MKTSSWMMLISLALSINLYSGCSMNQGVSKTLPLPQYPEEHELVEFIHDGRVFHLHPDALAAWLKMRDAARDQGIQLYLVSAFRSIKRQSEIVEKKRMDGLSDEEIFQVSARSGYSEHHTGKAIDLNTPGFESLEEEFEDSEAFGWLLKNANGFGFYLSYPRDNKYGIIYEPWHWFYADLT